MRKTLITVILAAGAATASAQQFDPATGAIIGGLVGHAIGNGNHTAVIVGGLIGAQIANGRRNSPNPPPVTYEVRQGPMYATVGGPGSMVPLPPQPQQIPCDEQYYQGVYDPVVAFQFCRGLRERARQDMNRRAREAYSQGFHGQY